MTAVPPPSAWAVPTELVVACANGQGAAEILRRRLRGVAFQPHALVWVADGGFRAQIDVRSPGRHGPAEALVVKLNALAQENLP